MITYNELIEFIESREYELKLEWIDKTTWADIENERKEIRFNLLLRLFEDFVHEYTHYKYDEYEKEHPKDERRARRMEKILGKKFTPKQIQEIGLRVLIYILSREVK